METLRLSDPDQKTLGGISPTLLVRPGLEGRALGEFIVKTKIGEGGFGAVYLADQPVLGREVVVKILHASALENPELRQRFLREAQLASSLDHPFAAHIYSFGAEPDGLLWIAMELVRGTPLSTWLKNRGPVPLTPFVSLFEKLCEVVHTLHQQGIVHRDLKPANVMVLSRAGRMLPKLLDLGIAKLRDDSRGRDAVAPDSLTSLSTDLLQSLLGSQGASSTGGGASLTPDPLRDTSRSINRLPHQMTGPVSSELTSKQHYLGSPAYMAPEQWLHAETDSRTDIYALGVLAFQALTGRLPFASATLTRLAVAHLEERPPPLGGDFPEALSKVIQKALAKLPENRFADTLAFAAAFREAAGAGNERATIPQLESALRESYLQEAPQPLAEGVAALEAAVQPRQAIQAFVHLRRCSLRYLALAALACRARLGALAQAPDVLELLRTLRTGELQDRHWWALLVELCRPFSSCRDAHPIPELVELCFPPGSHQASTHPDLEALLTLEPDGSSEAHCSEQLTSSCSAMESWLRRLLFLRDYPFVRFQEGAYAHWTGLRRAHRKTVMGAPPCPGEGELALMTREGALVVTLSPLIQAIAPTPGAVEEIFFLEGAGRFGAKLIALPPGFERHDEAVWGWFRANVAEVDEDIRETEKAEGAPYLGLSSFSASQSKKFFGREAEAEAFANRLRVQTLLGVVGPSGAGKSSFIQAGVIPLFPASWRAVTVRPGPTPLASLAERLVALGVPEEGLRAALASDADTLGQVLRRCASVNGVTLLLVVDQFEELVTVCADVTEREHYAELLARAARTPEDGLRVVLTLRDDFLIRVQAIPALRERLPQGLQLLSTPAPDDLMRIVTEPARREGYVYEDTDLVKEMVQAVQHQASALALLSFTASKLWDLRDRGRKTLTRKAYAALGGVGGALAHHAEATLSSLSEPAQALVREAFRHLVTAEGTRAILTRRQMLELLGSSSLAEQTLEALIQARLLTASEGTDGEDRVEVVHEALLGSWPRLVKWRHEDAESVRLRDELRGAARHWEARGRAKPLLWRGELLTEYRLWRGRYRGKLTRLEEAFARESLRAETRVRRGRQVALGVVLVGLTVFSGVVLRMNAKAHARLVALYEEQGRQALIAGDPMHALAYLIEARQQGAHDPGLAAMLARGWNAMGGSPLALRGHVGDVDAVHFRKDGRQVLTSGHDATARLYDAGSGEQLVVMHGTQGYINNAYFVHGGGRVFTSGRFGKSAEVFDARNGQRLFLLEGHLGFIGSSDVTPDEKLAVTGSFDSTARVWDMETGKLLRVLVGHSGAIDFVRVSPDGKSVLTGSRDHTAKLWDLATGSLKATFTGNQQVVWRGDISADNRSVVTGSDDFSVRLWDAATGKPRSKVLHEGKLSSVAFSPDSSQVITASEDGTSKLIDTKTGLATRTFTGVGPTWDARFSPDGQWVVTASADAEAHLYNVSDGTPLWSYAGHLDGLYSVVFSADGERLATASFDGTVRVWNARQRSFAAGKNLGQPLGAAAFAASGGLSYVVGTSSLFRVSPQVEVQGSVDYHPSEEVPSWPLAVTAEQVFVGDGARVAIYDARTLALQGHLEGHTKGVVSAVASADGRRLLTGSADHTARLWDVVSRRELFRLDHPHYVWTCDFSPDGSQLVTASQDSKVRIWDARTGSLLRTLSGHLRAINSAHFSGDGRRIVTASDDRTLKVWDARTGVVLATMDEQAAPLDSALFSRDGQLVYSAGYDGRILEWDAVRGKLTGLLGRHAKTATGLALSPDGKTLLSTGEDGAALAWDLARDERSAMEEERAARCFLPYEFRGDELIKTTPHPEGCRGAPAAL